MKPDVLIGIGNSFRRDDGIGLRVVEEVAQRAVPGLIVLTAPGEPTAIIDAWDGARLAVVVDAAAGRGADPGRIRRWSPGQAAAPRAVSSHAITLPDAHALAEALGRLPDRLVVLSIDVADTGYGVGLTPAVAAAVPAAVAAVLAELQSS